MRSATGHGSTRVRALGLRVLVVDDSILMRQLLADAVRASGVPVDFLLDAVDGADALRVLQEARVDVVFTGLHMPNVDGVELLTQMSLRPELSHVRVVVFTSGSAAPPPAELTRLRVFAYIAKPFRFQAIGEVLEGVNASRRMAFGT